MSGISGKTRASSRDGKLEGERKGPAQRSRSWESLETAAPRGAMTFGLRATASSLP